jgi:hypothetical protein
MLLSSAATAMNECWGLHLHKGLHISKYLGIMSFASQPLRGQAAAAAPKLMCLPEAGE